MVDGKRSPLANSFPWYRQPGEKGRGWGPWGLGAVRAVSQALLTGHYIPNEMGGAGLEEVDWTGRSGAGRGGPGRACRTLVAWRGAARALPSQEGQQGPWRGCAQGAGGQGSRWQDTEPSRQRQRRQGSPGGEKYSWWRAGAAPGRGQPAGAGGAAARARVKGAQEQASEGTSGEEQPRDAAPTRALRAAVSRQQDRLWTGQRRAAAGQALHVAALRTDRRTTGRWVSWGRPRRPLPSSCHQVPPGPTPPTWAGLSWPPQVPPPLPWVPPTQMQTHQTATQTAGVRGVGEVRSAGILFTAKGTACGRERL